MASASLASDSSRLAERHGDRTDRKFAEHMVADHTKLSDQLKSLVTSGKVKADLPTALDADHQQKLDELRKLTGRQFDDAYNRAQLDGHQEAVALFEQYAANGDNADLKQWASQTLPRLKEHLSMAGRLK